MTHTSAPPLVVDLDGTLTPTDTLHESLIQLVKQSPMRCFRLPVALLQGRAAFKASVAAGTSVDPALLPYRQDLLDYLRTEKAKGRQIILATAAHLSIAQSVAAHLGLFDQVLATDADQNLKDVAKLQAIRKQVGERFTYAGDSQADMPIWQAATTAILVTTDATTADQVRRSTVVEKEFPKEPVSASTWLSALRVHQWLKNLLLFVPLLTAFSVNAADKLVLLSMAFLAFSLAASGTYIFNDLWDLGSDRQHPRKCKRPFASARLPISHGVVMATVSLCAAFLLSLCVSLEFALVLSLYVVLTTAYSWSLKTIALIDVLSLSLLYTLRILAGGVAVAITVSSWLMAFSVFIFLSLALVKRCAELVTLQEAGAEVAQGRDYRVSDLVILWPMGVGAALSAVVVFGLFISAPETQARYATPQLLWLVAMGLLYWLGRLWLKTSRGEMHDDPVVYAIKDPASRTLGIVVILILIVAHTPSWSLPL
jgi:4-hydroxybenzoate polyprenyltransferase